MQMNDIIDGLNTCDYPAGPPVGPGCCGGFTGGCGLGSWIWILLILFYSNQGGYGVDKCCCGKKDGYGYGNTGFGCHGYLFLLVILFLCNGCNSGGCGGFDPGFDGALGGIC